MEDQVWIYIGVSLLGSGGIVAWLRARKEAPKLAAEAQSIIIENVHAENERLQELVEETRAENAALRTEIALLRQRIVALEAKE